MNNENGRHRYKLGYEVNQNNHAFSNVKISTCKQGKSEGRIKRKEHI